MDIQMIWGTEAVHKRSHPQIPLSFLAGGVLAQG